MKTEKFLFTEAINEMILSITVLEDEKAILQSMVDILGRTLNADRSLIYDIDLGDGIAEGLCEWLNPELDDLTPSIGKYPLDLFRDGCEWMHQHRQLLQSHNNAINPNFLKDGSADLLHNQMSIQSLLWYPFDFHSGRFYLLVFNQVGSRREWSKTEIDFLETAAKQVMVALKKARLVHVLEEREKLLLFEQSLFTSGPVVVFSWKAEAGWPVEYVSENIIQFGYTPADLITGRVAFMNIVHPDDLQRVGSEVAGYSKNGAGNFEQEYRLILGDGSIRYIYDYTKIIRNSEGVITHYHGYVFDITDRRAAEEALFKEKEEALVTLQSIGDGVIKTDISGIVQFLNPVAEELTGWSNGDAKGLNLEEIFSIVNESTGKKVQNPVEKVLREGRIVGLANHTILLNKSGKKIPIADSAAPIRDKTGVIVGVVLVFHDVMDARQLARKLEWQASHDSLTDLYNRREFENQLQYAIDEYSEKGQEHSMLYLDLDQFKLINDTCGHATGDELLRQLPALIQRLLGAGHVLARLGGDEFGILLKNSTNAMAVEVAEKIIKTIHEFRFKHGERIFEIGVSIGIVQIRGQSPGTLFSNADMACYAAKDRGRNRYHVFQEDDRDISKRQSEMEWVSRLSRAFSENKFMIYCQEIISLQPGNGTGRHFEILLRMENEEGKVISAGEFLSAAERYNQMIEIDKWVIDTVFKNYAENSSRYLANNIMFSVNLSGVSLSDENLLAYITGKLEQYNVPPEMICLEITETAAIANLNKLYTLMNELKSLGMKFSLDDFGSGLSSFAYLKHLPVDYIKIDGNFVSDIVNDEMDLAIVDSINHVGHAMNMKTIAEFVVSDEIRKKLESMGVDYAQGFSIHRPEPIHALNLQINHLFS